MFNCGRKLEACAHSRLSLRRRRTPPPCVWGLELSDVFHHWLSTSLVRFSDRISELVRVREQRCCQNLSPEIGFHVSQVSRVFLSIPLITESVNDHAVGENGKKGHEPKLALEMERPAKGTVAILHEHARKTHSYCGEADGNGNCE